MTFLVHAFQSGRYIHSVRQTFWSTHWERFHSLAFSRISRLPFFFLCTSICLQSFELLLASASGEPLMTTFPYLPLTWHWKFRLNFRLLTSFLMCRLVGLHRETTAPLQISSESFIFNSKLKGIQGIIIQLPLCRSQLSMFWHFHDFADVEICWLWGKVSHRTSELGVTVVYDECGILKSKWKIR